MASLQHRASPLFAAVDDALQIPIILIDAGFEFFCHRRFRLVCLRSFFNALFVVLLALHVDTQLERPLCFNLQEQLLYQLT